MQFASEVSLFINGQRASDPQPLPEALIGKPLYPTVTYKNVHLCDEYAQPVSLRCFRRDHGVKM